MEQVYYRTPLGTALLVADNGYLCTVSVRDEDGLEETDTNVPVLL
ncbi:hypothetical protein [Mucilaginibacter glaciei]|nr:hypothetical protein [Mucilaginibacter glaciei]